MAHDGGGLYGDDAAGCAWRQVYVWVVGEFVGFDAAWWDSDSCGALDVCAVLVLNSVGVFEDEARADAALCFRVAFVGEPVGGELRECDGEDPVAECFKDLEEWGFSQFIRLPRGVWWGVGLRGGG